MRPRSLATVAARSLLVLSLAGCSDPHSERLPPTDRPVPESYTKAVARLSDEDKALLSGFYKRHSMDITNRGKTIGDAIDDQRRWLENEPKRQERNAEALRQLEALAEVRVVGHDRDKSKQGEPVRLTVAIRNLGTKGIRKVEGGFELDNGVQKPSASTVTMNVEVEPGATGTWSGYLTTREHGLPARAESLGNQNLDRYKFVWKPSGITFADFSVVRVE